MSKSKGKIFYMNNRPMNPFVKQLLSTPTTLQKLLFSKYGNIEEDLNAYYINQIVYNKKTHYESMFKESQYNDYIDEFLRRFYTYKEGAPRIPKLSNYYKNYHLFFCRPIFREWKLNLIMSKYGDCKAEEFYNNNYGKDTNEDNDMNQDDSEDESSSDNDLFLNNNNKGKEKDNKAIIFDKKTKMYIDEQTKMKIKNLSFDNEKNTITLTLTQNTQSNNNGCLSSKRSLNSSFYMLVKGLLTKQNKKSSKKHALPNSNNNNHMNNHHIGSNNKKQSTKSSKLNSCCKDSTTTKSSLCSLTKNKNTKNTNIYQNLTNKILFSPELHNLFSRNKKSSLSEFSSNQPIKNNMKCTNDTNNNNNNNNNTNNNCLSIKNGMNEVPHHRKNKTYYCGSSCNGSNQGSLGNDNMSKDNKKMKKAISTTKRRNNHKSYNKLVSPISLKNPKMKKQIGSSNGTLNLVKSPRNISSAFSCFNLFMNMKTTNPNEHYRYINSNNTYHSNVKLSQTKASSSLNKNYNTSNNNNNLHRHKHSTLIQSQRSTNNTSSNNHRTSRNKMQTRNSKLQNYQINSIKTMNPSSNNQVVSSLSNQSNKTANLLFTTSKSFENSNNNNNNIVNNGGNFNNNNNNNNQTLQKQKMQNLFKILNTRKWPFDSNGRLSHYVPDKLAAKLEEIMRKTNNKSNHYNNINGIVTKPCTKFNRGRSYTNLQNENEKNSKSNNNSNNNNNHYQNQNNIHHTSNNIFGKTVDVIVTKRGKSGNKVPSSSKRGLLKNKYDRK